MTEKQFNKIRNDIVSATFFISSVVALSAGHLVIGYLFWLVLAISLLLPRALSFLEGKD